MSDGTDHQTRASLAPAKGLRTIRFDASDQAVFARAAAPDEWAVPGGFAFSQLAPDEITGKTRQAFANGFLGLASFGWSTFAVVAPMSAAERAACEAALAAHFVAEYGAPTIAAAREVAGFELDEVAALCADAPINSVLAVRRQIDPAGQIREEFRIVPAPMPGQHTRIWAVDVDAPPDQSPSPPEHNNGT